MRHVTTWWPTCVTRDADAFGAIPATVRQALAADDIEARPVWKPLRLLVREDECADLYRVS